MITYRADVRRDDDGFWVIHLPELDIATQARSTDEIEYMARDLIAIWLEVPADSFALDIHHA